MLELAALAAIDERRLKLRHQIAELRLRRDAALKTAINASSLSATASARAADVLKSSNEVGAKLAASETEMRRLVAQMESTGGVKEYEAVKARIAEREHLRGELETLALECMERAEAASTVAAKCAGDAAQSASEARDAEARYALAAAPLDAELDAANHSADATSASLPEALRTEYLSLLHRQGGRPVVRCENGTCDGCFTSVGSHAKSRILEGELVRCDSCGRFLLPG